jgi:hypothetical protein
MVSWIFDRRMRQKIIAVNLAASLLLLFSCASLPSTTKYVGPVFDSKSTGQNSASFESLWERWTIHLGGMSGGGPRSSGGFLGLSGGGGGGGGEFPIQITATLMDSSLIEAGLLHYADLLHMTPEELGVYRANYYQRYGAENNLLIWTDLSTSWTELYLDLKRWIVFIEDDAGNQHELKKTIEEPESYPLETADNLAGSPPVVEFRRMPYHQKRLMLCFAKRNFAGEPVLSKDVRSLKLVFQQNDDPKIKAEGVWVLKK